MYVYSIWRGETRRKRNYDIHLLSSHQPLSHAFRKSQITKSAEWAAIEE